MKHIVNNEWGGKRLDLFVSEMLGITRAQAHKRIGRGAVLVNGVVPKKAGDIIKEGDEVAVIDALNARKQAGSNASAPAFGAPFVVHEDPAYLVVHKPAGLLTHPTFADEPDTLSQWLVARYPEIKTVGENPRRPGIVHRLDREASGLLVVARSQDAFFHLKKQFQSRTIEKEYTVLCYGVMEAEYGVIDFAIDRGKDGRMVARPKIGTLSLKTLRTAQEGKEARTEFWVEERFARFTLLRVRIATGRTHQIRVHLYAYAHPVVGDALYVNKKLIKRRDVLGRVFLHAHRLAFDNMQGDRVEYTAPLPQELQSFLDQLK